MKIENWFLPKPEVLLCMNCKNEQTDMCKKCSIRSERMKNAALHIGHMKTNKEIHVDNILIRLAEAKGITTKEGHCDLAKSIQISIEEAVLMAKLMIKNRERGDEREMITGVLK